MSAAPAPAPLTYTVEHADLERFESLAYSRRHDEAGAELLQILRRLRSGGEFARHTMTDATRARLYTRLAAGITALLSDPKAKLSQQGYEQLAVEHPTIHAVFRASAFGNADHLVRRFSEPDPDAPGRIQVSGAQNLAKLLISYSLDSEFEVDFEALVRLDPQLALPAVLGMLAHMVVLSPAAHRRREKLLTLGPLLEAAELKGSMLTAMQRAYMHCSYATGERKHDIKCSFNRLSSRLIESLFGLPRLPAARMKKPQPTILLPLEWFHSGHAMYRCYAPVISKLREQFRLVAMAHEIVLDGGAKALFDEVIELRGADVMLSDALEQVARVRPDIIYYPSVGMAWCVCLSAVRLAPVQIASMGHPASTKSDAIDYVIVPDSGPGDASCYSEVLLLAEGMPPAVTHWGARYPEVAIEPNPSIVRIAVPAMVCKLNAPFLAVCKKILETSNRALEFQFFPDTVGLDHYLATREIRRWFPTAVIHPRFDYNEYLQRLGHCHLHLSPFPFGGTNSNIDSMCLGLPIVAHLGAEAHGQSDAAMIRHAGLPDSLIARSAAEYQDIALRLIRNDAERSALVAQLRRTDISARFLERSDHRFADDFLRLFRWIYDAHEAIQASGRRWWTVEDRRRSFPAYAP